MFGIEFELPAYYLIFCVLLSAVVTWLLYWSRRNERIDAERKPLQLILAAMRFIAVFLIAFFLLVPFVRQLQNYLESPLVVVGIDASSSVYQADSARVDSLYSKELQDMRDELGSDFNISTFYFGEEVKENRPPVPDKATNISSFLTYVGERYANQNLVSVLLLSDGIYNQGANPIYHEFSNSVPIYTVALGDTSQPRDLMVDEIVANELVYHENIFPLNVRLSAGLLKGEKSVLRVYNRGVLLEERPLNIDKDRFFKEEKFLLEASEKGLQQYRVELASVESETTTANNSAAVFVNVIEAEKKLVLLYDVPHPDIAALKNSVERNSRYEIDIRKLDDFDLAEAREYQLFLFHNVPSQKTDMNKMAAVLDSARARFFIFDERMNAARLNRLNPGFNIEPRGFSANEVGATFNENFSSFQLPVSLLPDFSSLPPLRAPFAKIDMGPNADVLLGQKIGQVQTDYPLCFVFQSEGNKTAVFSATGIWRWFMYEYAKNESFEKLDAMLAKCIRFLSVKADKRRFRVDINKQLLDETRDIVFSAQFYDPAYEPISGADIKMEIKNTEGEVFPFVFSPSGKNYELNIGSLKAGNYTYRAVAGDGKQQFTESGSFSVQAIRLEQMQPVANHRMLYQLADNSGGNMYQLNELDKLKDELLTLDRHQVVHDRVEIAELINNKWFFIIILLLLSAEWFVRKYSGTY